MSRFLRSFCVLTVAACALGCADAELAGGAAGNPALEFGEAEATADFDEAEPLEQLMARDPMALGVELPAELVIEKKIVGGDQRVRVPDTRVRPHSTIATRAIEVASASTVLKDDSSTWRMTALLTVL